MIQKNLNFYDINQVYELIIKFKQDLSLCVKIDEQILNFFKGKKIFRTKADLIEFSKKNLNYKVKKTRRVDIEEELTKVAIIKNLNVEKLKEFLPKPIKKVLKKKITPKRKPPTKPQKIIIEDQTSRWLSLSPEQLREELNDLERYPDYKILKQAAYSILKTNEKRYRIREKIVNVIIERIMEDKAIAHLGR